MYWNKYAGNHDGDDDDRIGYTPVHIAIIIITSDIATTYLCCIMIVIFIRGMDGGDHYEKLFLWSVWSLCCPLSFYSDSHLGI